MAERSTIRNSGRDPNEPRASARAAKRSRMAGLISLKLLGLTASAVICGAGLVLAQLVTPNRGIAASDEPKKPPVLKSSIVSWDKASSHKSDWGEMRTYFKGQTRGTRDVLTAVAVVKPGKAVHRAHRHAEEEYLIINEGSGTWHLNGKKSPARKGDILYVEPWVYHGLTNTGDQPLTFTVIRFNSKGIEPPPQPDAGKDER